MNARAIPRARCNVRIADDIGAISASFFVFDYFALSPFYDYTYNDEQLQLCSIHPLDYSQLLELNDKLIVGNIPPELGKLADLFDLYVIFLMADWYIVCTHFC
ncbi:unnamed protein product [Fraxinus pennsylvanica]|uniref:Uncharacterized protein n=1 Tax=Fraxinus pennsylvanica TaxID=56036 RepID=A0AAD1Z3G1_9LAMI|nr:unnamed protein product [Fraxinus pennsylvanica]